ncbi:hypothetical protein KGM48_03525 [Patescibacteria group bacterium]|nr:hypothetical protein [Patescibacteria group bacterium]
MKKVHFVGIGGIGMSALAQFYKDRGAIVTGSDRAASPVTVLLEKAGIMVTIGQRAENVPPDADLVVFSDAVLEGSEGFVERQRALELRIREASYFKALAEATKGWKTVAIAGTHGKTTTTGMTAKILKDAGAKPTAVIGSIVRDFGSNYLHGDSDLFVVEADEYRSHLLELSPYILVITNLEWDHTDWFPTFEALQATFRTAIERVPAEGAIVTDAGNPHIAPLLSSARARIVDVNQEPAYGLQLPGAFNQMNARAAAAAARATLPSITDATIVQALASFHGSWRRFEYRGKTVRGTDVFDDYGHHPTAVHATLSALRAKVRGKIYVVFHPHLYSRTRDLLNAFAGAFVDANKVLIAPIYAAREIDDGSVSSDILAERIRMMGTDATAYPSFDAIIAALADVEEGDTIITMGAGDIYKVADALVAGA